MYYELYQCEEQPSKCIAAKRKVRESCLVRETIIHVCSAVNNNCDDILSLN